MKENEILCFSQRTIGKVKDDPSIAKKANSLARDAILLGGTPLWLLELLPSHLAEQEKIQNNE